MAHELIHDPVRMLTSVVPSDDDRVMRNEPLASSPARKVARTVTGHESLSGSDEVTTLKSAATLPEAWTVDPAVSAATISATPSVQPLGHATPTQGAAAAGEVLRTRMVASTA